MIWSTWDFEGTEAAAATSAFVFRMSPLETMEFDRPFFLFIYDALNKVSQKSSHKEGGKLWNWFSWFMQVPNQNVDCIRSKYFYLTLFPSSECHVDTCLAVFPLLSFAFTLSQRPPYRNWVKLFIKGYIKIQYDLNLDTTFYFFNPPLRDPWIFSFL